MKPLFKGNIVKDLIVSQGSFPCGEEIEESYNWGWKKKNGEGAGIFAWKVAQEKSKQALCFLYTCVCKAHDDHQKFMRLGLI